MLPVGVMLQEAPAGCIVDTNKQSTKLEVRTAADFALLQTAPSPTAFEGR